MPERGASIADADLPGIFQLDARLFVAASDYPLSVQDDAIPPMHR